MDIFTETYVQLINEWAPYKKKKYQQVETSWPLPKVALATKDATNDFKKEWERGFTNKSVYKSQFLTGDDLTDEEWDEGVGIITDAFEFWSNQSSDFANQVKAIFSSPECPGDKVGLFAYAIWQGMTDSRVRKSGAIDDFKYGERVELDLTYFGTVTTTFNYGERMGWHSHWTNYDQYTDHDLFTCDKYPNITFDVVFYKGRNFSLEEGDKLRVNAKVKGLVIKKSTVYLNYAKLVGDVIKAEKPEEKPEESSEDLTKN